MEKLSKMPEKRLFQYFRIFWLISRTYCSKWEMMRHRSRHIPTESVCDQCGKVFTNDNNLHNHLNKVHKTQVCSFCNQIFPKFYRLKSHINEVKSFCSSGWGYLLGHWGRHGTDVEFMLLIQLPRFQNTARIFSLAEIFLLLQYLSHYCFVRGRYWRDQTHLVL